MPRARAATAAMVKPGFLKRLRRECFRSCHRLATGGPFLLGVDCLDGAACSFALWRSEELYAGGMRGGFVLKNEFVKSRSVEQKRFFDFDFS